MEPISPFRGLYACVTRERPEGGPKDGWQPQEKISHARLYPGSAYAQFEEGKKGELKPAEYADFIILSNDLRKIPPAQFYQDARRAHRRRRPHRIAGSLNRVGQLFAAIPRELAP